MSQRVIVGLEQETDVNLVKKALEEAGAESVKGPAQELPDVLIVTIPSDLDINEFVCFVQEVEGVRYAEPDSWQFTA